MGSLSYVVPCACDKLIESVINEPDNTLDITVPGVTAADGTQNRFTLYVKDKAGNEVTKTVWTDAEGNLSITINDPDNIGINSASAAISTAKTNEAGNIYSFLLNDTITVNLNIGEPEPESYTVTFESNGGSAVDSFSGYTGDFVEAPGVPLKDGYTFDGWYTDIELTQQVTWPFTINEADVIFYAMWSPIILYTLGDVNADGIISPIDALMALKSSSGGIILTDNQKLAADVNLDGSVTPVDALNILQYVSGKITSL